MEKTMRFLSIAALALVGAVMTGCSSEDNFTAQPQQQVADKGNVVTVTATVGLGEQAGTRKLTIDDSKGVKTFAEGDKIAVIYENASGTMVKAETAALTAADITSGGKSAKITVSMTDPKASGTVKYIYPAEMAGATDVDYTKLNTQDGSLDNLGKKFDLAVYDGTLTAEKALPASATLENKLAILALTIKDNAATPNDLTSSITSLKITDGTNTYSVTRSAAAGPIYVAIKPTTSAAIGVSASDGTNNYCESLSGKTYAVDNGYSVTWKMDKGACLAFLSADYEAKNGETLTGKLASKVKVSIAAGATVTLKDVDINADEVWTDGQFAGITCAGTAIIILEGTNTVKGFNAWYSGINVPKNETLTIKGTGTLNVSSGIELDSFDGHKFSLSAGIGANNGEDCGNIVIEGGTITATGANGSAGIGGSVGQGGELSCGNITISGGTIIAMGGEGAAGIGGGHAVDGAHSDCGNIEISGGTVTATGGSNAAGIGGGYAESQDAQTNCGAITIESTVTKVTATKGTDAPNSIGAGKASDEMCTASCGTVKIGGTEYWDADGGDYNNNGETYLTTSPLIYEP